MVSTSCKIDISKHGGVPLPPVAMGGAVITQRLAPKGRKARRLRRAAAIVLAASSGTLLITTLRAFTSHGTTLDPTAPGNVSVLITGGTNSISRNPMYLGLAGILAAGAISRGSWQAWLPVGGFVLVLDRFQIVKEERALLARFGEEYLHYAAHTPRWLDGRTLGFFKQN